jgi:sigma-B regulation protein RsbU (phosphoserine phosphatase)
LQGEVPALLREELAEVISGGVLLSFGLVVCSIAAIRWRSGVRLILWLGIWSTMYGAGLLARSPVLTAALPHTIQASLLYVRTGIAYLTVVVGLLAFLEVSLGRLRFFIKVLIFAGTAVAVAGVGWFASGGSENAFIPLNTLVAILGVCLLIGVVTFKNLSERFMVLLNRRVIVFGTLVFATEALGVNVAHSLGSGTPLLLDNLTFGVLLLSFAYVAVERDHVNERRLVAIDNELDLARQLQFSILPTTVPDIGKLRIGAAYRPMTAVAGDFYDFIPVDGKGVGFLVADVTGHGVPAALIASMIKVAVGSVVPWADQPREVLRELNRILLPQLRKQLVSAAYLWVDTKNRVALYSAAGHPPLLRWRKGNLERIESNGLLLGVMTDPQYPVCDLTIESGDRFLLYTDGVIEPENSSGDSFGDNRLEQVVHNNQGRPPSELPGQLLTEIEAWQPASLAQQDDITLLVIDVV